MSPLRLPVPPSRLGLVSMESIAHDLAPSQTTKTARGERALVTVGVGVTPNNNNDHDGNNDNNNNARGGALQGLASDPHRHQHVPRAVLGIGILRPDLAGALRVLELQPYLALIP